MTTRAPSEPLLELSPKRLALLCAELQSELETLRAAQKEPIAIVGMGCRFPGGNDPESFWRSLRSGSDLMREVPDDRWDIDALYDPDPDAPGKMYARRGGFVPDVDQFDALFFGISPREAAQLDPQQRLLLEVSWEALEHAGCPPDSLAGSHTGVFVGIGIDDYAKAQLKTTHIYGIDAYTGSGNAFCFAAGRISYVLGLNGPSLAVDTACSTSLVTVHLACQSLRLRECNLALAGGVNLMLSPEPTLFLCKARALARDGHCKAFDSRADGYVRSEGCGMLALKRLSDAVTAGDRVLAVIRGSAVNHGGSSSGLTVPNGQAQAAVIREALTAAGVEPHQVSYLEAHGTGTALGDPVEMRAIAAALGRHGRSVPPLLIGSVKTNVGHLEVAAGVASLIKVILALQHQEIPPHLHLTTLNPNVHLEDVPAEIPTRPRPWVAGEAPRRAGVSSFGLSGTNAHLIVEEAPPPRPQEKRPISAGPYVLPLSARSHEALEELARRYLEVMSAPDVPLDSICYTAGARRSHHANRVAVVADSAPRVYQALTDFLEGNAAAEVFRGCRRAHDDPKVAFVFTGQGCQWPQMGRELLAAEPVFRATVARCDAYFKPLAGWSLHDALADASETSLARTEVAQPVVFALQVGLVALWRDWGVRPRAVVGHSMGEVAAAHTAGALQLEDALALIHLRGRLMQRAEDTGGMIAVALSEAGARDLLAGFEERLHLAASNGPFSSVLSGDVDAIEEVASRLDERGVFCRRLPGAYPFHTPGLAPLAEELEQSLRGIRPRNGELRMISTVTGRTQPGAELDARYWARNLIEPVKFADAVSELLQMEHTVFLEIGPHPVLGPAVAECIAQGKSAARHIASLRRPEAARATLLRAVAAFYAEGLDLNWRSFQADGEVVNLPNYPWRRERHWFAAPTASPTEQAGHSASTPPLARVQPMLARRLPSPLATQAVFESRLGSGTLPFLADHVVFDTAVLPFAAFLEAALEASASALPPSPRALTEIVVDQPLILSGNGDRSVRIAVNDEGGAARFRLESRREAGEADADAWVLHVSGRIVGTEPPRDAAANDLQEVRGRCPEMIPRAAFYQALAQHGFGFGPSFRGVEEVWRGDGEAVGRVHLPEHLHLEAPAYRIHPALLDPCLQLFAAALPRRSIEDSEDTGYLPTGCRDFQLYRQPGTELWAHVTLTRENSETLETFSGDLDVHDSVGLVGRAKGLDFRRVSKGAFSSAGVGASPADWLYEAQWQPQSLAGTLAALRERGTWLIFADRGDVGTELSERLERLGERCVVVNAGASYRKDPGLRWTIEPGSSDAIGRLLQQAVGTNALFRGIVHLWSLDAGDEAEGAAALQQQRACCGNLLHVVQALGASGLPRPPRLWLVTRGAQPVVSGVEHPAQAPLWGLARVIGLEHPELRCGIVDLDPEAASSPAEALVAEVWADGVEDQVGFRGGQRYVRRLMRQERRRKDGNGAGANPTSFRIEVPVSRTLDALVRHPAACRAPGAGEVQIRVHATGLNFKDVLSALGLYPAPVLVLGDECAGVVTAVGDGVRDLAVGDLVVALAPGSFASHVVAPARLVVPKPGSMSFEQAATFPINFLTAHLGLFHVAQMGAADRVLIHSASGGVGLAALQLAQRAGAEVIATAGTEAKREHLRSLGVRLVMDSRSLAFAAQVWEWTAGEGVDIVLNSLSGEAVAASMRLLKPGGRFVEIGKRGILGAAEAAELRGDVAYTRFALDEVCATDPALVRKCLDTLAVELETGRLELLPHRVFPVEQAADAFRFMAQARHIGKIVVSQRHEAALSVGRDHAGAASLREDATYLIAGGTGALGLHVAGWMANRGARHLVLLSRSRGSDATLRVVRGLRERDVQLTVARVNITDAARLSDLLSELRASSPPVRGVVHAASVLDDGVLLQQSWDRFAQVMAPAVNGAWNLHLLTRDLPLDFFVIFSSAAALLGSSGQGNYAAAGAFLDALAHYRRRQGLPAISINWGPWAGGGMAASVDTRGIKRWKELGLTTITPEQGLEALQMVLAGSAAQSAVLPIAWSTLLERFPAGEAPPFISHLARRAGPRTAEASAKDFSSVAATVRTARGEGRRRIIEAHVRDQVLQVLGLNASHPLDPRQGLLAMGMDSLMGVDLRNRLYSSLGHPLRSTLVFDYPTVESLVAHLDLELPRSAENAAAVAAAGRANPTNELDGLIGALEELSDEEAQMILDQQLAKGPRHG